MKERKTYRYRKVTPENVQEMKELREKGKTYGEIAKLFNITDSTAQYHISPAENKRKKEYSINWWKRHPEIMKKQILSTKKKKYVKEYIFERYNNDLEFRKRFLENVKKSQKKIRNRNKRKGLCPECGNKRDSKFLACEKCRKSKRISYHRNKK